MAQAVKLANNFLSATALAATSEAVAFGTSVGLDMATMLEVLNASSGQAASSDKFVNHVLTERYSSGFANTLMAKDVGLYAMEARSVGVLPFSRRRCCRRPFSYVFRPTTSQHVDFTRIHPFTVGR